MRFAQSKEELSIELLHEWWITTTLALSSSVGFHNTVALLKPYYINCGSATAKYLQNITGLNTNDINAITIIEGASNSWILRGKPRIYVSDDAAILEITGCTTKGKCKEACILICNNSSKSLCETINPSCSSELMKTLSNGDDLCRWIYRKGNSKNELDPIKFRESHLPEISKEEIDSYTHQVLGELWVISTRVVAEQLGSDRALDLFDEGLTEVAESWSECIGQMAKVEGTSLDDAVRVRELLSTAFQRSVDVRLEDDGAEGEVHDCPFSNAPPEICQQYHLFLNIVLESLSIPFQLTTDTMMTMGENSCHWAIRKKDLPNFGDTSKPEMDNEGMSSLEILKKRLARGEISLAEYRELKNELME